MRNNVLERVKSNDPLVDHIDLLFNIFCNEFCKIGNPTLILDKQKLYTIDIFARQKSWVNKFSLDSDFSSFLSIINYAMQ